MSLQLDRYIFGDAVLPNQPGNANYCLATHRQSKKQYILKIYSPQSSEETERINYELNRNTQAQKSKGVVEILDHCHQSTKDASTGIISKKTYILMRYVATNLRDIIAKRKSTNNYFSYEELERHIRQLLKTLAEFQDAKISHGRIELEKIFAENDNGDLLIGDFWDAQNLFDFEKSELVDIDYQNVVACKFPDQDSILALMNGQDKYLANYYKQDVYSLGIVVCQMATLNIYSNHLEFNKKVKADKASILERYGQEVANLIDQLLAPRKERQDFTQLIKDVNKYFKRNRSSIKEETRTPSSDRSIQQFPEKSVLNISQEKSDLPSQHSENSDFFNDRLTETEESKLNSQQSNLENMLIMPNYDSSVVDDLVGKFQGISGINEDTLYNYQSSCIQQFNSLYDEYDSISKLKSIIRITQNLNFADLIQSAKSLTNLTWIDSEKLQLNESLGEGKKTSSFLCSVNQNQTSYVAKKYYENDNFRLLEILKNFSKLNSLDIKLGVKIDFFNIQQIQGEESRSELIIIQKRKIFSLATLVEKYRLCLKDKVKISGQIASILMEMHQNNVIHGALKPENILLDMQKNVFLADFGQYEMPSADFGATQMCASNYFQPVYSSPEQFNDLQICKNSDIWSLGIIIYQFVFEIQVTQAHIEKHKLYDPSAQGCVDLENPSLTGLVVPFSKLIKSMTQFDPEKRIGLDEVKKQLDLVFKSIKVDRQTQKIEPAQISNRQPLYKSQQSSPDLQTIYQQQQQQQQKQQLLQKQSFGQKPISPATNTNLQKNKS